jgi:uncharacterized membrane protein SpoIIM required for sporulation
MKVVELLKQRRENWQELEQLCGEMENRRKKILGAPSISRFATLYRSACADLALADAYQLPPNTVQYLHRLVGRAHNQLYRSRTFDIQSWTHTLLTEVPRKIFDDRCVQTAFCLFWGVFITSAFIAMRPDLFPAFAEKLITEPVLEQMQDSFADPIKGRNAAVNPVMASYYIQHNTSIGLQCFVGGILLLPGVLVTVFNASHLGACFGYMARPDIAEGGNFFHFVTAHGPFELTAIVLSAGAGLRLGMSWVYTNGLKRVASLVKTAEEAMPIMGAAIVLFFLAALIEGFVSPSALPYEVKAAIAVLSSGLLMAYFVILGFPKGEVGELIPMSNDIDFDSIPD